MRIPAAAPILSLVLVGAALAGGALAGPSRPRPAEPDFLRGWKKVVLSGRRILILEGEVTLTLSRATWRRESGETPADPVPAVVLGTETQVSIFGVRRSPTRTYSYLDAGTHRSLEFEEVKEGHSAKRILFGDDAFRYVRARPPKGGQDLPPEQWEVHFDEVKPYRFDDGAPLPKGEFLHDSFALLYLVMETDLEGPDHSKEFVVLYRDKLFRVKLTAGRVRDNDRKIRDLATGTKRRIHLREREILLSAVGAGAENARALSMKGEIEIWVDDATHTIVEVSGKVPGMPGRTRLDLEAVEPGEA